MFFDFLFARHRKVYIALALQYWVSPNRVYKLAHGSNYHTETEHKVQHELLELGILHRHK